MKRLTWIFLAANAFAAFAISEEPSDVQIELAALNDTYRVARGLNAHVLDADLCKLCQRHAEWMASTGSFRHGGGENVICYGASTPAGAIGMWRGSGPHNSWLLSRTTRAGWGHAVSAGGTHYWAGVFRGEPTPSEPANDTQPQWRPARRFLGWFRGR